MYIKRAKILKEIAIYVKNKLNNDFSWINNLDIEIARRKLMEIPGIGRKTADVILLFLFKKSTFPIDTHITRITNRLGLVKSKDYEEIRNFWMKIFKPEEYLEHHLKLIEFGRKICKARNPKCNQCKLKTICKEYNQIE